MTRFTDEQWHNIRLVIEEEMKYREVLTDDELRPMNKVGKPQSAHKAGESDKPEPFRVGQIVYRVPNNALLGEQG